MTVIFLHSYDGGREAPMYKRKKLHRNIVMLRHDINCPQRESYVPSFHFAQMRSERYSRRHFFLSPWHVAPEIH